MDGRKALEVPELSRVSVVERTPGADTRGRTSGGRLPLRWAWFAALVGPVVAAVSIAIEPTPADPDAPESLMATILGMVLLVAWFGAAASAARRHPVALAWAGGVGGFSVVMALSCPISGHHAGVGAWWFGQLAVAGGALALSLRAWRSLSGR